MQAQDRTSSRTTDIKASSVQRNAFAVPPELYRGFGAAGSSHAGVSFATVKHF